MLLLVSGRTHDLPKRGCAANLSFILCHYFVVDLNYVTFLVRVMCQVCWAKVCATRLSGLLMPQDMWAYWSLFFAYVNYHVCVGLKT